MTIELSHERQIRGKGLIGHFTYKEQNSQRQFLMGLSGDGLESLDEWPDGGGGETDNV